MAKLDVHKPEESNNRVLNSNILYRFSKTRQGCVWALATNQLAQASLYGPQIRGHLQLKALMQIALAALK